MEIKTGCAPVLLFTFKRLDTLKKTVSNLLLNPLAGESDLIIFSDQGVQEDDKKKVADVRCYLKTIRGFRKIEIIEASENKGLAKSVISGVTEMVDKYGRVIVLEDDILTTPNFLSFMNAALDRFEEDSHVFSISGYSFNLTGGNKDADSAKSYFINRGWSWGWATWKDRWVKVDWSMKDYEVFSSDASARKKFSEGGSDLNLMLKRQMDGKLDSWAIRWFYHQFKVRGLTLYPVFSKVYNDGFDDMATHTTGSNSRYIPLLDRTGSTRFAFPENAAIDPYYQKRFQKKLGVRARIVSRIQTVIGKLIKTPLK